jgi:hypothetical protein
VTTFVVLRIQHVAVDDNIEDALGSRHQRDLTDDVLIVEQQILGRAHGAV